MRVIVASMKLTRMFLHARHTKSFATTIACARGIALRERMSGRPRPLIEARESSPSKLEDENECMLSETCRTGGRLLIVDVR